MEAMNKEMLTLENWNQGVQQRACLRTTTIMLDNDIIYA
jgi:hypothetical protein